MINKFILLCIKINLNKMLTLKHIIILPFIILLSILFILAIINYIDRSECGFGIFKIIYLLIIYLSTISVIFLIYAALHGKYCCTYFISLCGLIMLFLSIFYLTFGIFQNTPIHIFYGNGLPTNSLGIDGSIYIDNSEKEIYIIPDNSKYIYVKFNNEWKNIKLIGEGEPKIEAENNDIFLDKNSMLCYIKVKNIPLLFGSSEDKWVPIFQEGENINQIIDQNKIFYNKSEKNIYNKIDGIWFKNYYDYVSSCKNILLIILLFIVSIILIFNGPLLLKIIALYRKLNFTE